MAPLEPLTPVTPLTPLARTVMERLVPGYSVAADPERAAGAAAYLRHQFPFLGIAAGPRRELSRRVLAGLQKPAEDDLRAVALACWDLPEREYQHFAVDWLGRYQRVLSPGFLDTARVLITTKSWWDTVDALAAHPVGTVVATHPATVSTMDEWAASPNLWLARTAVLHQLRRKETTDEARLFEYCEALAGHHDFFVRKAIGWALRAYAYTAPDAVRRFVAEHPDLSPLSVREALKHL